MSRRTSQTKARATAARTPRGGGDSAPSLDNLYLLCDDNFASITDLCSRGASSGEMDHLRAIEDRIRLMTERVSCALRTATAAAARPVAGCGPIVVGGAGVGGIATEPAVARPMALHCAARNGGQYIEGLLQWERRFPLRGTAQEMILTSLAPVPITFFATYHHPRNLALNADLLAKDNCGTLAPGCAWRIRVAEVYDPEAPGNLAPDSVDFLVTTAEGAGTEVMRLPLIHEGARSRGVVRFIFNVTDAEAKTSQLILQFTPKADVAGGFLVDLLTLWSGTKYG